MVFQEILFDVIKKDGMTVHELSKKISRNRAFDTILFKRRALT